MKILRVIAVASLLSATSAWAASSVTLFGVVDDGLRYQSNGVSYAPSGAVASRGAQLGTTPSGGGLTASFWGMKGSEDLGNGLKAIFLTESDFDTSSGKGLGGYFEYAYVGLQSASFGQFTMGRQPNVAESGMARIYGSNRWAGVGSLPFINLFRPELVLLDGGATNNMARYAVLLDGVTMLAQYSLSSQPGGGAAGTQMGISVSYVPPRSYYGMSASVVRSRDDHTNGRLSIYTAGGHLDIGNASFNLGYLENTRDNNFTTFANGPFTAVDLVGLGIIAPAQVANPDVKGGFQTRSMVLGGVTYQATPVLTVAANGWYTRQTGYTSNFNGSATQFQLVAGYQLSKRTTAYAEVDHSSYRGGLIGAQLVGDNSQSPTVGRTQTGAMVGVRHAF